MAQTILVVDDDASIRDAVSFYMRREGYDVLQAKDGQAAMEVIATEKMCIRDRRGGARRTSIRRHPRW